MLELRLDPVVTRSFAEADLIDLRKRFILIDIGGVILEKFIGQLVAGSIFLGVVYLIGRIFEKAGTEVFIMGAIFFVLYVVVAVSKNK